MRIVLFDTINERHVGESLERALLARGHEVLATGRVWQGTAFPDADERRTHVKPALKAALAFAPDAVLCLRAAALHPRDVGKLRRAGAHTLVWFPDDPVLYKTTYRHVVDAYDTVLHCGPAAVLEFYERRHGPTGVNFPFWTDSTAFPPAHDLARADVDAVFLGNLAGPVRSRRYGLLAALPVDVRVHGKVDDDPAGIAGPYLREHEDVVAALARARVGVSLAQRFADYRGLPQAFGGLAALGSFELPSRVVQYAATGLPVVAMDPAGGSEALPEMVVSPDHDGFAKALVDLLADPEALAELGRATHARFEARLSAERRVELLERLIADPGGWRALPVAERATLWRADDPAPAVAAPRTPARPAGKPVVVVAGYYGMGNTGDELILRALADRLADAGMQPLVAAQRPAAVVRDHGLPAFARLDPALTEAVVRASSAVVIGGGGLLHDVAFARAGGLSGMFSDPTLSVPGWAPLVVLAKVLDRPLHLFGLGVGPLVDPDARRLADWLAAQADTVSVRDAGSRDLLGAEGVEQAPDPVYALDLGDAPTPPGLAHLARAHRLLVVNLRPWDGAEDLTARAAAAVTAVARRHGLAVVALPMQGGAKLDEGALVAFLAAVGDDVPRIALPWSADAPALAAILRASAAALVMRLHAGLLAHRAGTPAVGLAYDPKVAAHFDEVGRAGACLPLDASTVDIEAALESALATTPGRASALDGLERDAHAGLDRLADRLSGLAPATTDLPEAVLVPTDAAR